MSDVPNAAVVPNAAALGATPGAPVPPPHIPHPTSHIPHPSPVRHRAAALAASLNPVSLFFGPIFQKEVRTAGRKLWGYIGRAVYAGTLLSVVGVVMWSLWVQFSQTTSSVQRLQEMQQMAPALAITIIWFQFVVLGLTAPTLTGPAIADEKRTRTLATLLTTPLTAAQIIGGKLAGRLVQIVILALLAVPLLLAVRIFGGLEAHLVLQATAVSLSTAVLGASLGLLFSIWNNRGTHAGVFGLLTLALMQGVVPAVDGMMYLWYGDHGYDFHQETLAACSPATLAFLSASAFTGIDPPPVSITLEPVTATSAGRVITLGPMWLVNTIYSLSLAALFTFLGAVALRRTMQREAALDAGTGAARARSRKERRAEAAAAVAAGAALLGAEPREVQFAKRDRQVGSNPVLWREVRQPTFGSRQRLLIAAGVAAAGLVFLYWNFGIAEEGLQGSLAVIGALAVMLQSVFMTTGGFVTEREGRTWDVLLTTPLSAREIVWGKFAGALRAQWFLPTVVLIHTAISVLAGVISGALFLHMVIILAGPMLMFTATGLLLSLFFKRSTPAAICNLLLALGFWLGPWLLLMLYTVVARVGGPDDFVEDYVGVFSTLNPVAMAVTAYDPARMAQTAHARYDLSGFGPVSLVTFTLVLLTAFAVYAGFAGAALWATLAGFRRFSGRVS